MKKTYIILVMLLIVSGIFTLQSCKEEEGTITSYAAFTRPTLVAPVDDAWVTVTGTTVTLQWASTNADGNTDNWDVYFGTSATPPLVKKGNTSQSYTATVAKGKEYFWRVVGKNAAGIPTRSETWSFKVIDPAAEMEVEMSWETDVEDAIGLSLDPDEVVDLRLLVLKESDRSPVAIEDGSSFETFADFNTLPDGSYLIATDIYSTIDAGDFNAAVSLSLELVFSQPGTVDQTIVFPDVMDNLMPCEDYFTILAKVVKVGTKYTITKDIAYAWSAPLAKLAGTWYGVDNFDYPTEIVTAVVGGKLTIDGIGFGWMEDWWSESIVTHTPLEITFDWNSSGEFSIAQHYHMTTLYGGDNYDYDVVGTGKFLTCGDYPVMMLTYDILYSADGFSLGGYVYPKYSSTPLFETTISLDPSYAKGGSAKGMSGVRPPKLLEKPTR